MVLRRLSLVLGAAMFCAATAPPALERDLVDGQLPPGEYRWAKGRFDDATEQETPRA